jgi:hypothetical protein
MNIAVMNVDLSGIRIPDREPNAHAQELRKHRDIRGGDSLSRAPFVLCGSAAHV